MTQSSAPAPLTRPGAWHPEDESRCTPTVTTGPSSRRPTRRATDLEAFEKGAEVHGCDYCLADAREIQRALDGADIMDPHALLRDLTAAASAKEQGGSA